MARKGKSQHLKRLAAPASWPIHRKEFKWTVKPKPGPHSPHTSLPLLLVVRDVLGLVKNRREAQMMLAQGHVKVDGRAISEGGYPVGLMDVIEVPIIDQAFRMIPSKKGLNLHVIKEDEKTFKLCKIVNKTTVHHGNLQLNAHDGRNFLIKTIDPKNTVEDVYNTHDVLKIEIPNQAILDHLPLEAGVLGVVERGKRAGTRVEVKQIVKSKQPTVPSSVVLQDFKGNQFETILDYVFPIGKKVSWISLPEETND
ncbi:MAG: 30S ribosomal protein S4e [Candidatus Bathyarchaeota archaeon]|nr:MAG: 30S ribosomal protein S4e [Candidatus Bathyarchaeota archaeon]